MLLRPTINQLYLPTIRTLQPSIRQTLIDVYPIICYREARNVSCTSPLCRWRGHRSIKLYLCLPRSPLTLNFIHSYTKRFTSTILPSNAVCRIFPVRAYLNPPELPTLLVFFKLHFNHSSTKHAQGVFAPSGFLHFFNQTTSRQVQFTAPAPAKHYPLNLSSPFTPSKTLHFNHLAAKRTAYVCPCQKQGIHPPRNHPLYLCFFKPINHIAAKQRLPLLAPKDNYHFTSTLYIRSTFSNHSSAKRTACVCTAPAKHYPLNLSSPFTLYSLKTLHLNAPCHRCPRPPPFMQVTLPPCRLRQHCTPKPRNPNMKLYRFPVILTKFFIKPRLNVQILFIATHGINRTHAIDRRPPYPSAPLI